MDEVFTTGSGVTTTTVSSQYYDATEQFFAEAAPFLITSLVVGLLVFGMTSAGLWFLFKKAGQQGWKAVIPFYNFFVLFQIADINPWLSLLLYFPVISFIMMILTSIKLAKAFGQGGGFAFGLFILTPVFVWLLGVSDKYEYQLAKGKHVPFAEAFERPEGEPTPAEEPSVPYEDSTTAEESDPIEEDSVSTEE